MTALKVAVMMVGALTIVSSAPQKPTDQVIAIIKQDFDQQVDGSYRYSFETENGIKTEETGTLKKANGPDKSDVIVAQGGFSYTAPDGTVINLNYIADDESGFRPEDGYVGRHCWLHELHHLDGIVGATNAVKEQCIERPICGSAYHHVHSESHNLGAHLPTPPPIPPAIQKALDFLATLPPPPPSRN